MIWESCYWKEPLLKERKYLSQFRITNSTKESTLAGLEKRIFISFYAIRKLIEANKLTKSNLSIKWEIASYLNIARVDIMNWYKIDEKYDLSKETYESKNLRWICNQIIHSFVFVLEFRKSGLFDGVFVSSDRDKNKRVHYLTRKLIFEIFDMVGNDYPYSSFYYRNKDGELVVENRNLSPEEYQEIIKSFPDEV